MNALIIILAGNVAVLLLLNAFVLYRWHRAIEYLRHAQEVIERAEILIEDQQLLLAEYEHTPILSPYQFRKK